MALYVYRFENSWQIETGLERVWAFIHEFHCQEWWPGATFRKIGNARERGGSGVGNEYVSVFRTKLLYKLSFRSVIVKSRPPFMLKMNVTGNLEGRAVWYLNASGDTTYVNCILEVNTNKRWMSALAPVLKPVFVWNHNRMVKDGTRAFADYLGVHVIWNRAADVEGTEGRSVYF